MAVRRHVHCIVSLLRLDSPTEQTVVGTDSLQHVTDFVCATVPYLIEMYNLFAQVKGFLLCLLLVSYNFQFLLYYYPLKSRSVTVARKCGINSSTGRLLFAECGSK